MAVEQSGQRNSSSLRRLDSDLHEVHARLDEWARESKGAYRALGLPTASFCEKWSQLHVRPEGGHEPVMSDRAFNVDRAVQKLGEIDRSVIWRFYMAWRDNDPWKGLHAITSRDHFDRVLKRARYRVQGYLAAIE